MYESAHSGVDTLEILHVYCGVDTLEILHILGFLLTIFLINQNTQRECLYLYDLNLSPFLISSRRTKMWFVSCLMVKSAGLKEFLLFLDLENSL